MFRVARFSKIFVCIFFSWILVEILATKHCLQNLQNSSNQVTLFTKGDRKTCEINPKLLLENTKQYKNAFSVKKYKKKEKKRRDTYKKDRGCYKGQMKRINVFYLFYNSNCYQYKLSYTFRFINVILNCYFYIMVSTMFWIQTVAC